MAITITGGKYSAATLASVGTINLTVTAATFSSGDFAVPRRADLYDSSGNFKGMAFVRQYTSTTVLELESEFFNPNGGAVVTQVAGDIVFISKNWADVVQAGIALSNGVVTVSDTITFGTSGTANSLAFHDENLFVLNTLSSTNLICYMVAGGFLTFGHLQSYSDKSFYGDVQFLFTNTNATSSFVPSSTAARLCIWGGSHKGNGSAPLYFANGRDSGGVFGTDWAHLWCYKTLFDASDVVSKNGGGNWTAGANHVMEVCSYVTQGVNGILNRFGNGVVRGGQFKILNASSNPISIFGSDNTGTYNIGADPGDRTIVLDMGTSNVLWRSGLTDPQTVNLTNVISTDYRAGTSFGEVDLPSTTVNVYFSNSYTNLGDTSTLVAIKSSDWSVVNAYTASGANSIVAVTVLRSTGAGYTMGAANGPWVMRIRKYGYDELEYSVAESSYSLGTAGTAFDVSYGGIVNQIARATLTDSQATADAYAGITVTDHGASPVEWPALSGHFYSITVTVDLATYPSLTAANVFAHIKSGITKTSSWNGKVGLLWHVLMEESSSGYVSQRGTSGGAGATLKGVNIVDTSGNALTGMVSFTDDAGNVVSVIPPVYHGLAFTGLIAGSQVKVFTHGTTTELFSTTNSGTTETFSQVYTADITVDYTIFKDGYVPIRIASIAVSNSVLDTPIQQVIDRAYQAPSGLAYGTTATVNAGTKQFGLTVASTGQNWYSFMVQSWRNQSALANIDFPLTANGPNSFTLGDGWVWDGSASINYLSRDGMRYLDVSGNVTAIWAAFLSVGIPAGQQVRFEQVNGSGVTNAAATGNIDQLVQILSDPNGDGVYTDGYDYRGFMVLKVQGDGYDQAESDAVSLYGNLEDQLFVVGLTPTANGIGAATITGVTITDHGASPVTWNGKVFSITITDTTDAHTGTEILQYVRGLNNFNYHDLVQPNGSSFKTVNGNTYGGAGATVKGVRVVRADGTSAHLSFDTFTADDGTAYSPTVGIYQSVAINGLIAGSRVQIYDTTNSAELINAVVAGTSHTWTDSVVAAGNRDIRVRIANQSAATAYNFIDANIGTCGTTALTAGISYLASQTLDTTYNTNAIDGSTVTGITITPSPARVQINIAGGAVTWPQIYAYQVYWLATATGIADEAAFISAPDTANYILTAFSIRNTSATPLTITGGFGRDSVSGLVKDCIDTAGSTGNIFPMPDHAIPYSSGSGLTAGQAAQLTAVESNTASAAIGTAVWSKTLP